MLFIVLSPLLKDKSQFKFDGTCVNRTIGTRANEIEVTLVNVSGCMRILEAKYSTSSLCSRELSTVAPRNELATKRI